MKTSPEFAALAYRRATLQDAIVYLQRQYLGVGGLDPKKELISEDVFYAERIVPQDFIQDVVDELTEQRLQVELEMRQYEFGKKKKNEPVRKPQEEVSSEEASTESDDGPVPGDDSEDPSSGDEPGEDD